MKTNILFISLLPPVSKPKSGGEQTFSYYFRKFSEDNRFAVKLITCAKYSDKDYFERELCGFDKKIVYWRDPNDGIIFKSINIESKFNLFNRNAGLISNTTSIKILRYLKELIDDAFIPDAVILEWTEMVVLARSIRKLLPEAKIIASEHDITYIGYERKRDFYSGLKKIQWNIKYLHEKVIELESLNFCDIIMPHNIEHSKKLIDEKIDPNKIFSLIPSYNDLSYINRNDNGNDIVFLGALNREENVISAKWFIDNVMPYLNDLQCRFVVLGNNPNSELVEYESEFVHITGFVDDVSSYFEKAKCFVAPLQIGAGIKIKVLEAMSSGIPVLTNSIGIEGIPARAGMDYYYCVSQYDYSKVIHEIFYNMTNYKDVGQNGKNCIKKYFSPSDFYDFYSNLIIRR